MGEAVRKNYVINRGATFVEVHIVYDEVTREPRDLTGYTAKMQARLDFDTVETLFDITPTVGTTNGKVTMTIPDTETSTFDWEQGRYDVILTSPTDTVERILQGYVAVSPEVTRDA